MEKILTSETLDALSQIQSNCTSDDCYECDNLWPPGCDDCSRGSCSGGCSYTGD